MLQYLLLTWAHSSSDFSGSFRGPIQSYWFTEPTYGQILIPVQFGEPWFHESQRTSFSYVLVIFGPCFQLIYLGIDCTFGSSMWESVETWGDCLTQTSSVSGKVHLFSPFSRSLWPVCKVPCVSRPAQIPLWKSGVREENHAHGWLFLMHRVHLFPDRRCWEWCPHKKYQKELGNPSHNLHSWNSGSVFPFTQGQKKPKKTQWRNKQLVKTHNVTHGLVDWPTAGSHTEEVPWKLLLCKIISYCTAETLKLRSYDMQWHWTVFKCFPFITFMHTFRSAK